jgi:type IV pilus assembly protein PilW
MSRATDAMRFRGRGFTLVELLVAVTVGLLLTVILAQIFLGSRGTYATTDELSRMQENIRFTHQLLMRIVYLTSHMSSPNSYRERERAPDLSTPVIFDPVSGTAGFTATQGAGTQSDSFTVRFQGSGPTGAPDGTITDCLGRPIDGATIAINTFTIAAGANGGNALFCNNGIQNLEVVPDIENMQILLGEDTEPWREADGTVNRFVPFSSVANPDRVLAIRFALLFRTPNAQANVAPDNRTYDLNGVVVGPFNDTRLRRAVVMTISMRNRTN